MNNFPSRRQIDAAQPLRFDGVTRGDDPRVTEVASARIARKRAEALNDPQDDPPPAPAPAEPAKPARSITLATTISYRDYEITITATGLNLDQFCDMLDRRLGVVNE